jgi:hypothetical protein
LPVGQFGLIEQQLAAQQSAKLAQRSAKPVIIMTGDPAARPARHRNAAPASKPAFVTGKETSATTRIPRPAAVPLTGPEREDSPEPQSAPEPGPSEPAPAPQAPATADPAPGPGSGKLPQLARVLGGVVAPTTLLTALLYYFGWLHAYYLFGYFGVNSTALGFNTVDYLMRSVDALYVPLAAALIVALLALWGNAALLPALRAGPVGRRSRFVRVVTATGITLVVAGGSLTLLIGSGSGGYVALAPVSFALGVVIVGYAVHMRRVLRPAGLQDRVAVGWAGAAEWMIAFFLIAIALFTAASDYAGGVGVTRARQLAAELPAQPAVVLYSQHNLDLPPEGITRTRCASADAGYRYRYDGLVLVLESAGEYLLLPRQWSRGGGFPAILLPESDAILLEFYPGTAAPAPSTAAC